MCVACADERAGVTRRGWLAGLAAVGTLAATPVAAACFTPADLAGTASERLRRRLRPGEALAPPVPAAPGPPLPPGLAGVIRRVELPPGAKLVALSFDLCQTRGSVAGYDGAVVDYLRAQSVPATFFAGGQWLATHRERSVQLAADPLFLVGNHSWTHHDLHFASATTVANEILVTEAALAQTRERARVACSERVAARAPRLFRFPYGSCAAAGTAAANMVGSVVIQWDVVSGDPDGTPASVIVHNVFSHVRPGSIVVMHANGRGTHTAEALARIVPQLRADGFAFVTVERLLASGRPVAAVDCFIEREGDTARYDRPAAFKAARALR